jgi:hypothetical protein
MKLPQALLVKLSPLVEAARGEPLIEPFVQIVELGEGRLQVDSAYGSFTFDRGLRLVHKDGARSRASTPSSRSTWPASRAGAGRPAGRSRCTAVSWTASPSGAPTTTARRRWWARGWHG